MKAYLLITIVKREDEKVFARLKTHKEVKCAAMLYGPYDGLIEIEAQDIDALNTFILEQVRSVPEISMTSTMIVAKEC